MIVRKRLTNVSSDELVLPSIVHCGFPSVRLAPGASTSVNIFVWNAATEAAYADPGAKRLVSLVQDKKLHTENEYEE